jgi:outer membrane receptor protein involved in Fe transport
MNYSYIPLRFLGFFLACGAATLQSIPACAQNAGALEGQGLEEIVVTATRRETDLEKTPISISVLGSAAIEKNHVVDLTDVTRLTPSLVYMPRGGSEGYLSLRGAIIFDDSPGTDPAVSTYIDDIVRVSVADVQPDVYDLDRVEVLKGPQGTLFGRNSIGGVVSMYTNQPTFKNGGTAEVTYGAHNLVELKGCTTPRSSMTNWRAVSSYRILPLVVTSETLPPAVSSMADTNYPCAGNCSSRRLRISSPFRASIICAKAVRRRNGCWETFSRLWFPE